MNEFTVKLKITTAIDTIFKPSVDVTLLSVAPICNNLLVVILTGMGDDGLRGCQLVKQNGGTILSESEKTCVVYGMPKAVFEAGVADKKVTLHEMFDQIMGFI
jgi:two-component system, chemotaxis family, protein-glutamate methylesterase/glutaminase